MYSCLPVSRSKISSVMIINAAQHVVHPTLGSLAASQAAFYALSFFYIRRSPAARPSAGNANR